jgi:hypothetical protein
MACSHLRTSDQQRLGAHAMTPFTPTLSPVAGGEGADASPAGERPPLPRAGEGWGESQTHSHDAELGFFASQAGT